MTSTLVLDPTTHVTKQRTTFVLPSQDTLSTLRLGGLAAYIGADGLLNTSSGIGACIDSITLRVQGATVQELRNASAYIAMVNTLGSADDGCSTAEALNMSNQRFVPYTLDQTVPGPAVVAQTSVVCSYANVAGIDLAGAQETLIDLRKLMPFLQSVPVLQCSQYRVELEILYQSNLANLFVASAAPAGGFLTPPYLIVDQLKANLDLKPTSFPYVQVLTDMVVVPNVVAGAAQSVSLQSRGFVGRTVQGITFCKTPSTISTTNGLTGGYDASYAQSLETVRLWVDGQQMTSINSNPALMQSYTTPHRAPLVCQRPLMERWASQVDSNTSGLLGSRSYLAAIVNRRIEQSLQIDYSRTGYNPGGEYAVGEYQINLIMFARCLSSFTWDPKTQAVVVVS